MNREEALKVLRRKDAILENPVVVAEAIKVVQNTTSSRGSGGAASDNSGDSENPVDLLVNSYKGAIEFLFEIGTWLTYTDDDAQSTRNIIESVVMETILQNYDRNKAIKCLTEENVDDTMEWLSHLIESARWRQTIYELAQQPRNEDCPFLSLTMPCIAVKEELIGELISVPLAWNTLEIFLKCVAYILHPLLSANAELMDDDLFLRDIAFLQSPSMSSAHQPPQQQDTVLSHCLLDVEVDPDKKRIYQILRHFLEMGCHSEQTYLIIQSMLQCLIRQRNDNAARHLSWLLESEASRRGRDVSRYSVYFCFARNYPTEVAAMRAILSEQSLLPQQLDALYAAYRGEAPPPVSLIRQPFFIGNPERLLSEQQECYAYLYAYASVTAEKVDYETECRLRLDRSRVAEVNREVLEASRICKHWNTMTGSAMSLRAFRDLPTLLQCLHHRAISFGVFRFLWVIFRSKRVDFELNLETMKPYCIVVNELATLNPFIRPALLSFITELLGSIMEGMEDLSQVNVTFPGTLEFKRMLVGLLVHLITCGYVLPTIRTMHSLFERNHVDVSIARHFVTELLSVAAPPYDPTFMNCLHPLVSHPHIVDGLHAGRNADLVKEFLGTLILYFHRKF
ncbi:unnamed protein product [Hydatigera taeniaeformis]|uniref:Negative elongation factor D n=1 Tax=Hydatigena taeniaeformis TaxID=6205 RepID=A0A0R3X543_HYDTA|nr:unnamed protein product [Hydatigera taeniaeformis]